MRGRQGLAALTPELAGFSGETGVTPGGRKRAIGRAGPAGLAARPNQRWSLDFVSDQLSDGRRFPLPCAGGSRRLHPRYLALVVSTSLSCLCYPRSRSADRRPRQADAERLRGEPEQPLPRQCLNEHLFRSLPAARCLIDEWRLDYNHDRPHTSWAASPQRVCNRSRWDHNTNRVQI